jgi:hypothetical protein
VIRYKKTPSADARVKSSRREYAVPAARVKSLVADHSLTGEAAVLVDAIRQWLPPDRVASWKLAIGSFGCSRGSSTTN